MDRDSGAGVGLGDDDISEYEGMDVPRGFGADAEQIGNRLNEATDEFLKETKASRALAITPGLQQLCATDFVEYLGIDMEVEPELVWLAREMLAAPMPPNAELRVNKSGVVYFHDKENDYYTIEHPLTQRYLKVLERQRLDLLVLRTKPSVNGLLFKQPDMIFHTEFRNLQIPCQSCGVMQSTLKCEQCLMSFCQACCDAIHANCQGPRKNHTFLSTACGSLCSTCAVKKPQVFCANCEDYFCFKCFENIHRSGSRLEHKSMLVTVSDGEIIEPQKRCEECEDNPAAFACDYCLDNYCIPCFWKCHFNGHRRNHTASKICVTPLCNQCNETRATVFCEQCQELMCTECFTLVHAKGNRQLHLFLDAMDLLVLLERLDPAFQEHLRRARPRALWAISQLQAWMKGIEDRRFLRKRRDLVTAIQRRWRGTLTRRKLLGMLYLHKWRRRQINSYFLPKPASERRAIKQKCSAMLAAKDIAHRAANASLIELKETIMDTANADPMEDPQLTRQALGDMTMPPLPSATATSGGMQALGAYTSYEGSRFPTDGGGTAGAIDNGLGGAHQPNLATKDIRDMKESTYKQIVRLEDPPR